MKHTLLQLAVSIMCIAIRRYGWRDDAKPPPYTPEPRYPWWRYTSPTHIEVANFSGAIHCCVKEMIKAKATHLPAKQPIPDTGSATP